MRIVRDMPSPPESRDKAARRARRRWLARRRCLRALRATITFMVLVTPFLYFGYLLCCRMPFGIGSALPNWILLYEFWMFFRNCFIFFRYLFLAPFFATLPLLLNIYFILLYPPGHSASIDENLYFELFKNERLEVVELIQNGKIRDPSNSHDAIHLPQPYTHTAMRNGEVIYKIKDGRTAVIFSTGWNFLSFDQAFCYIPDDIPSNWLGMDRLVEYKRIEDSWYFIVPQVTYLQNILDTPPKRSVTNDDPPPNKLLSRPTNNDQDQEKVLARFRRYWHH
ncbi:hypothetical protein [Solidesulfovibrio sp.]|uniref:hypothetical protein n=1 Tax=Solidesulfovibrio sp. TaxID=2910990 RepID=UPI002B20DD96|nr:hypothetical protein [Solidesulfovibrio sp.]MEA4856904.1 hypothetical protein [Solidesulfovibrio sp.]